MALKANLEVGLEGFTASEHWIARFKDLHNVCDQEITKFVTEEYSRDEVERFKFPEDFVPSIQPLIDTFGSANVYNADQSPFEREIHSKRKLADKGKALG